MALSLWHCYMYCVRRCVLRCIFRPSPSHHSSRRGNPSGAAPREGHGVTLTVDVRSRDRHVVTELATFMLVYNYAIFKSLLSKSHRRRDDLVACVIRAQGRASH